jgi:hypothetical protein
MSLRRAAAVLARRAANAAAAAPAPAPHCRAATTHAKLAGKVESSGKADIFGLFAGLGLSAGFVAYDLMYPEEVRLCVVVCPLSREREREESRRSPAANAPPRLKQTKTTGVRGAHRLLPVHAHAPARRVPLGWTQRPHGGASAGRARRRGAGAPLREEEEKTERKKSDGTRPFFVFFCFDKPQNQTNASGLLLLTALSPLPLLYWSGFL